MPLLILLLLSALLPLRVATADSSGCQQQCYIENSRCDRDSRSGCSSTLQSCLQACAHR